MVYTMIENLKANKASKSFTGQVNVLLDVNDLLVIKDALLPIKRFYIKMLFSLLAAHAEKLTQARGNMVNR